MSGQDSPIPSHHEIAQQLDRIVRSPSFSHADKQASLLSFIVRAALKGDEISEKIIAGKFFPPYDPESTIVRTNLSHLRKRLAKYYAAEGRNDPVTVIVPQGRSYKPAFGYNGLSVSAVRCAQGFYYLERAELLAASGEFYNETQLSDYIPGFTGLAHADLLINVFRPHGKYESYHLIEENIAEALKMNPGNCEAHVLAGAAHACRCQWDAAKAEFDTALAIDGLATRGNWWYIYHLLVAGDAQQALQLADAKLNRNLASPLTIALAAGVYYLLGSFDVAGKLLHVSFRLNPGFWPTLLTSACVALASDEQPEEPLHIMENIPEVHADIFPGLRVLCLARAGKDKQARALAEKSMRDTPPMSPAQIALAHLGLGEKEKAIRALARGRDSGDPIMALLEICPLFGPLQNRRAFQTLLRKMRFPTTT